MSEIEEWKDVPTYEEVYQVSTFGNIRKWLSNPRDNKPRWKYLIINPNKTGYKMYTFSKDKRKLPLSIHRLVMIVFKPIEGYELLQVNHIDLNKSNNNISNLEWNTPSQNATHKIKELKLYGDNACNSKLTTNDVLRIKELKSEGKTQREISKIFNVSDCHISDIIKGKKWKHL